MEYLRNILYEYMMGKEPVVSDQIMFCYKITYYFQYMSR